MNKLIAIVGMCGSGKSVATEYFKNKNYEVIYFGGVTMKKLKEENLEVNPENEKMMRERLRKDLGMGAYAKVLLDDVAKLLNIELEHPDVDTIGGWYFTNDMDLDTSKSIYFEDYQFTIKEKEGHQIHYLEVKKAAPETVAV